MKQPKQQFDITTLNWREQSNPNRTALDILHFTIRSKTDFVGKINKTERNAVKRKFHHLGIVCFERPLKNGDVERWVERYEKRICEPVIFEKV